VNFQGNEDRPNESVPITYCLLSSRARIIIGMPEMGIYYNEADIVLQIIRSLSMASPTLILKIILQMFPQAICRRTQGPPSRVLSSHFWLVSGAGAATPFLIYIGAFAHIIPKNQSCSSEHFAFIDLFATQS
jgi:hypothetical protein